jgi:hypothetical protein
MSKTLLAKLTSLSLVIIAFIDTNLQVLNGIGLDDVTISWIKFVGLVIAAVLPAIKFKPSAIQSLVDDEIGGGGIKVPPKS